MPSAAAAGPSATPPDVVQQRIPLRAPAPANQGDGGASALRKAGKKVAIASAFAGEVGGSAGGMLGDLGEASSCCRSRARPDTSGDAALAANLARAEQNDGHVRCPQCRKLGVDSPVYLDSVMTCHVCLDQFEYGLGVLTCGHVFCKACIADLHTQRGAELAQEPLASPPEVRKVDLAGATGPSGARAPAPASGACGRCHGAACSAMTAVDRLQKGVKKTQAEGTAKPRKQGLGRSFNQKGLQQLATASRKRLVAERTSEFNQNRDLNFARSNKWVKLHRSALLTLPGGHLGFFVHRKPQAAPPAPAIALLSARPPRH
jgi:hypothetical protein